jgi:peptidase C39-like protein
MNKVDPAKAMTADQILKSAQAQGFTKKGRFFNRRGNGMYGHDAATIARQNGFKMGEKGHASWADIKAQVDQGRPVGASIPVDSFGNPKAGGNGWHAVIVKGHFTDQGTDYVVATHSWPGAQTKVWKLADFEKARRGTDIYWIE